MKLRGALVCGLAIALTPAGAIAKDNAALDRALETIVAGAKTGNPLSGAVLAVRIGEKIVYEGAAGCAEFDDATPQRCARPVKADTKMRVASISKMATAMAALALARDGALDLDRDVSDYLGWTLRNPAFPDRPITARHLMTHLSSLRDPEEYWVAAPGEFRALVEASAPFAAAEGGRSRAPGDYFTYANVNYGVLATVMEKAAGARFDDIVAARVIEPLGLDAGFNWSGVSTKARRSGATLYRSEEGRWIAQTDGAAVLQGEGPAFAKGEAVDAAAYLASYSPGANATLFSPQGGLRASMSDLLVILDARDPLDIDWRFNPQTENGDPEGGFYPAAGMGALALKGAGALWPGAGLLGHSGEAYGLYAGLWRVAADPARGRKQDVSFAYAVTGASKPPVRGAHPAYYDVEEPLVRLAMAAAEEAGVAVDGEPRPFDPARDAMTDVDAALARARATGKRALLVLGGNWCHDSRGLAEKLEGPALSAIVAENYELVWVDVGRRDRNLDIARRFGVASLLGTPTVLILSADGILLNADSVHDWRAADSKTLDETIAYFAKWAGEES